MKRWEKLRRVDLQVSLLTAAIVICSCLAVYFLSYSLTYADMISSLQERVLSIHTRLEPHLTVEMFREIENIDDEDEAPYQEAKALLDNVKNATGVRYLYTATRTETGDYIYLVDGLPPQSGDFRHAGEPIEPEIIPELEQAMAGEMILPDEIKPTSWGYIFIAYLPVHDGGEVAGVLGIEFDAAHQYTTFRMLRIATPLLIIFSCLVGGAVAMALFRRISNPSSKDLATTDFLTGLQNRNAFEVTAGNLKTKRALAGRAVIALDLDGLKRVNDVQGHRAGDEYIRACARSLEAVFPKQCGLYRIGGDEFAVVLTTRDEAEIQRLLLALAAQVEKENETAPVPLFYSAGYAICDPALDETLYSALDRADTMMYENKRSKRGEAGNAGRDGPPASQ